MRSYRVSNKQSAQSPVPSLISYPRLGEEECDGGDSSNHSTFVACGQDELKQPIDEARTKEHVPYPPGKTVRFATGPNLSWYAANTEFSEECWYTPQELWKLKGVTILTARKLAQSSAAVDCRYRRTMTCTYNACCNIPYEVEDTASSISSSLLCQGDEADLIQCVDTARGRYGLERMTSLRILDDAKSRRKAMWDIVTQKEEDQQSEGDDEESSSSEEEEGDKKRYSRTTSTGRRHCQQKIGDDKVIQTALEEWSRPSRLWAREIARALEQSLYGNEK